VTSNFQDFALELITSRGFMKEGGDYILTR